METHVVLADHHIPFMNEDADTVARKIAKAARPDVLWLLGDLIDFAPISKFRDAERYEHTVQDELDMTVDYLIGLRKQFPNTVLRYKMGNHDLRLKYYLWSKNSKLKHLRSMKFEKQFREDRHERPIDLGLRFSTGTTLLGNKRFVLKHGSRFGVYATKAELDAQGRSGLSGHNHRTTTWAWRTPGGGFKAYHHIGCLCDLEPLYLDEEGEATHWNHGMAVLTVSGTRVAVENVVIDDGMATWRGKEYTA